MKPSFTEDVKYLCFLVLCCAVISKWTLCLLMFIGKIFPLLYHFHRDGALTWSKMMYILSRVFFFGQTTPRPSSDFLSANHLVSNWFITSYVVVSIYKPQMIWILINFYCFPEALVKAFMQYLFWGVRIFLDHIVNFIVILLIICQ